MSSRDVGRRGVSRRPQGRADPLPARVFQVVDAFDAMTTDRRTARRSEWSAPRKRSSGWRARNSTLTCAGSSPASSTPCRSASDVCAGPARAARARLPFARDGRVPFTAVADLESRMRELGEFIRDQRRVGHLSLRKLSEMAGISNPYLSQIERGLRKPSAEILQQLARASRSRRKPSTYGPGSSTRGTATPISSPRSDGIRSSAKTRRRPWCASTSRSATRTEAVSRSTLREKSKSPGSF